MITDITLTSALVIKLMRSRTGWKRSDSIIRKIVAYALSSGLLFTLLAATCFLLTLVLTGNLIYIGISNIGVKVYVLSLLTVIKSRKMLATRMMEDTPLPSFPSSPATRPTVGEQSAMEFAPVQVLAVNIHTTSFAVTDPSKPSYLAATASDSTVHAQ
ncbi:hypothetical protein GSI_15474 [Ganoderma sinense ZZ0214-1]|uniref:DUF6534 domain-containing protein n=1 Tax=Ganoderma sinense ZZ0214-1 TaxID=1077348 RepID=A0A2G8RMP7_9APHY|nr:hypothetical protein GSI_15474 [Ganoderma sinense ZZ0214-1]